MDLTRFFLYTALAVISYLMLLAWQEDYPPTVANGSDPAGTSQEQVATTSQQVSPADADIPTEVPDTPASPPQAEAPGNVPPANTLAAAGTVRVTTDSFELAINLNGGDITYLALPQYLTELDVGSDPFVILTDNGRRTYVSQSGLIGRDGIDSSQRATYSATADSFTLEEGADQLTVDLTTRSDNGVEIIKRFHFTRGSYLIDIEYLVNNRSTQPWQGNIFGQIKRDDFDDPSSAGGFGRTYLGFVTTTEDDPYVKIQFDDIDGGFPAHEMAGGWIGFSQHYFLSAWIPGSDSINRYGTRRNELNQYFGGFTSEVFTVAPGASASESIRYYAGPKDQYVLADIAPNLDLTIDYGFLWFLAAPIYWLLRQINSIIGNYGMSIILLTVIVKALFYKLSETQYKSMAGMRRLMPKMQQIKERYGEDRMRLQKETMELYKKEKINPFGGCLPMLVQMPVFIALYWVLLESVELRHAPFILWLEDLSVRDPFFILPLLMGATMFLQTKLSPTPADPMQAKVMTFMPIMMTVLFLWFPAGLVLYWLTNGLLGILQQWYITRKIEAEYEAKSAS